MRKVMFLVLLVAVTACSGKQQPAAAISLTTSVSESVQASGPGLQSSPNSEAIVATIAQAPLTATPKAQLLDRGGNAVAAADTPAMPMETMPRAQPETTMAGPGDSEAVDLVDGPSREDTARRSDVRTMRDALQATAPDQDHRAASPNDPLEDSADGTPSIDMLRPDAATNANVQKDDPDGPSR